MDRTTNLKRIASTKPLKTQDGRIVKVSGPLVVAENMAGSRLYDMVRISSMGLIGEIIEMRGDLASIQVYEETSGIGPGEPVRPAGEPLSVELGPGLLSTMFDGIQRPLDAIQLLHGDSLTRGVHVPSLDRTKKWNFVATVQPGTQVKQGDAIGYVMETSSFRHWILVPPGTNGTVEEITEGKYTVTDVVCRLQNGEESIPLTLMQKWPVRSARPYTEKFMPKAMMVTGQRVIDTFFPVAKGGTACIPGPFGSGKTVVQHQLAKWSDSEIVVYIGCGERGNEMTDVMLEFPQIINPKTGASIMEKTVLIANTSNMPVAAREASIYTGMTIAEYFRDMGYSVSLMADSTSRWAEALREMSGRLNEMPGDEGYPAYLGSRLADIYERAGIVQPLGAQCRVGSVTMTGAVSPPGGDISEPVSQSTLRIVKVFWGLSAELAYQRHFPAIGWTSSYSLYQDVIDKWMDDTVGRRFSYYRQKAMVLLAEEARLNEIVNLVGKDALSEKEQLALEMARTLREDYMQQNAFRDDDTYTPIEKQYRMLRIIIRFYEMALDCLDIGVFLGDILSVRVLEDIASMKYIIKDITPSLDRIYSRMENELGTLSKKGGNHE